jgi:hypothetical protein
MASLPNWRGICCSMGLVLGFFVSLRIFFESVDSVASSSRNLCKIS